MKKILFKGCGTAISTPFNDEGVNLKEFARLIEEQIKNQVDSIIVCGTTGESATMTEEERLQAEEEARKQKKNWNRNILRKPLGNACPRGLWCFTVSPWKKGRKPWLPGARRLFIR